MFKCMLILALSIVVIQYVKAVCNKCQPNGVACISRTEFQLCFNGKIDASKTYKCLEEGHYCTRYDFVCTNSTLSTARPACGDNLNCGQCGDFDGSFACTSRTTFTMCFDHELSDIRSECPEKQICDVTKANNGEYPCVPSCRENDKEFKMCDLDEAKDEPQTTTVETPTTTTELPTTTTQLPITTEKVPEITTTEKVDTSTTPKDSTPTKPTTEAPSTETTTQKISTTTEEVTTTTIFAPTPKPQPTTTTTEKATTTELPTTTQNPAELVCSKQTAAGRYPYPNDTTCKNYIYCYRKGGVMQSTILQCPNEFYFNPSTTLCQGAKPQGCI